MPKGKVLKPVTYFEPNLEQFYARICTIWSSNHWRVKPYRYYANVFVGVVTYERREMKTPIEIYLFPYGDSVAWADTDESEDKQGVKYVRADLLNEIKAQAVEDAVKEIMGTSNDIMVKAYANTMLYYSKKLRGENERNQKTTQADI